MIRTKMHPAQRDIFTDQLINITSPHYNIGLCIKLKGVLNVQKFRKAVTESPEVFDVFKMRFDTGETELSAYIADNYDCFEMQEQDVSHSENPQELAESLMQKQFNTAFRLQKENPLFEQYLIKITNNEYWFFFRFHHIITDAYGFVIWINYLSTKYKLLVKQNEGSFCYPSYLKEAVKEAEHYNSQDYTHLDHYWKSKIKETPQNLLHKKYLENSDKSSSNFYLEVTPEIRERLWKLQEITKANLHQLTVAAVLIYFRKTLNEKELVLGVPYHKRGAEGQRNMLGMFSGILPFKQIFTGDLTVSDLVTDIKNSIKEDNKHRNYLIGDLSRSLNLNISGSYLCDISVNYVPFNFDLDFGEAIKANIHWISSEHEKSPLQICWRNYGNSQSLELGMHYGLEYFDKEEIELFSKRIVYILEQLHYSLNKKVSDVSILPLKEREILQGFNKTVTKFESNKTIVSCFKDQAIQTPDNVAVVFEQKQCTYKELDEQSNQLASYLQKKGVRKETLVPICIERSIEMIVGILGILKAGGAYVPIDPENPEERIRHILEDTKADIIITSKKSCAKIPVHNTITKILINDKQSEISREASDSSLPEVAPHNLAYVIYTSGSTGRSKGVMVEHQSYMNIHHFYHNISPGEQTILTCAYMFDVSVLEIFSSLLRGGCLNIPTYQTTTDPNAFATFLYNKKISTAYIPPMYLTQVADVLGTYDECYLKKILIGVEPISKEAIKWYLKKDISVINGYGPTETTICATFYFVSNNIDAHLLLPIGKPIENYDVFILDDNNQPSPVGVAGQICIGGAGLARGYLNRPELTEEKFVKNSFGKEQGARLYKTGDLGRWLTDGNIEYIGRIDNQVKIRGYRIELGEIESVLLQSKLIKQCVVIARTDKEGNKQLIGYAVPGTEFNRRVIVAYLKSKLPDYMVPALWVSLECLPLTINGKVDRKALPEPDLRSAETEKYVAPRTDLEVKLAAIWKQLLNLETIGIYDNFFSLGGHSLMAVQLIIRIEKLTGIILPLSALSAHPTISALSVLLSSDKNKIQWKSLVPIKPSGAKTPLYIVHGAGLNVLIFRNLAESMNADQPVYGLQSKGLDGIEEPLDKIEDMASFYISEILQQNSHGPYAIAGYSFGGIIAFEMAKQLKKMNKEVKMLAMFDSFAHASDYLKPRHIQVINKIRTTAMKIIYTFIFFIKEPKLTTKYKVEFIKRFWGRMKGKFSKTKKPEDKYYTYTRKILDMNDKAFKNYKLTPYFGSIDVFKAKKLTYYVNDFKFFGWKPFALKGVQVHNVPGEHKDLLFQPNVKVFSNILQNALDK